MDTNKTIPIEVESKLLMLRGQRVLLDRDVAELYGVETKEVNQAVKNNPDKFPAGYIIKLNDHELEDLRSKILTANLSMIRVAPKAFTEKGLYMLATILKSKRATSTTLAIVETFAMIRELSRTVSELSQIKDKDKQKTLMQKGGEIIAELLDNDLDVSETETSFEIDFSVMKFKHIVKKKKTKQ